MLALLLIAVSILPAPDATLRDRVDLIELNHFFDFDGRLVFDQAIFLDWNEGEARYDVRAWRLVKSPQQIPQRAWPKGYVAEWIDGDAMRRVDASEFRETFTQHNPELSAREVLPKESRRELRPNPRRE